MMIYEIYEIYDDEIKTLYLFQGNPQNNDQILTL